jgi:hypothetical protein
MTCKNCSCGKGGCAVPPDVQRDIDNGILQLGPVNMTQKTHGHLVNALLWGAAIGLVGGAALFCAGTLGRNLPNFKDDGMSVDGFTTSDTPTLESRP